MVRFTHPTALNRAQTHSTHGANELRPRANELRPRANELRPRANELEGRRERTRRSARTNSARRNGPASRFKERGPGTDTIVIAGVRPGSTTTGTSWRTLAALLSKWPVIANNLVHSLFDGSRSGSIMTPVESNSVPLSLWGR